MCLLSLALDELCRRALFGEGMAELLSRGSNSRKHCCVFDFNSGLGRASSGLCVLGRSFEDGSGVAKVLFRVGLLALRERF